jgi:hypothetical protein
MESDWRDPREVEEDFSSGDPTRIALGLKGLCEFSREGDSMEISRIGVGLLAPFGESVPDELVLCLSDLLIGYRSFVPEMSREERISELVELAIRYALPQVAHDASIEIQIADDPPKIVRMVVAAIGIRGLHQDREVRGAELLIGFLLDANPAIRRPATEAVMGWPKSEAKSALVEHVLSHVDPDQREALLGSAKAG